MSREHSTANNNLDNLLDSRARDIPVWKKPDQFDLNYAADRREVERRLVDGRITTTVSRLPLIADELFDMRHPDQSADGQARKEYTDEIISQGSGFGIWHDFSWNGTLQQFPSKQDHQDLRTFRNRNLITEQEQASLLGKTAVVFGLSVGSHVADQLVRGGVCGTLVIGDFDTVSPSNLNRMDATAEQIGWQKIDVVARRTSELDPYIEQVHFRDGATPENLARLAELKPDIIFDEIDQLAMKAMLREFASKHKIPLVMATDVGDKSIIDVERHDLEEVAPFNGRLKREEYEDLLAGKLPPNPQKTMIKIVGARNLNARLLDSVTKIGKSLGGIPQLGTTAAMGGALAAITAREILVGRTLGSKRGISSPKEVLGLRRQMSVSETVQVLKSFAAKK